MSAKHTPTPWALDPECGNELVLGPDGITVADCCIVDRDNIRIPEACRANAEFIVRACNSHEELLAALEAVVAIADRKTVEFDLARAAIAKAKGGDHA